MTAYDIAIVGGGVIGCAILYELSLLGYRCILLEKHEHLLQGASSGNSGHAHTGYDAPQGSFELQCIQLGRLPLEKFCKKHGVPFKKIGAILIAWNNEELELLPSIVLNAHKRGSNNVTQLTRQQILALEPNLNPSLCGGILIPDEAVIDSWLLPALMAHLAVETGNCEVHCNSSVVSGTQCDGSDWILQVTNMPPIRAKLVINAAGLHGDTVEQIVQSPHFNIRPRQGQFIVYDKHAGALLHHIILPIPSKVTKGVLLFPSVHGNLVVGPTAEDVTDRTCPKLNADTIKELQNYANRIIPALENFSVLTCYAGLRPATQFFDYCMYPLTSRSWLTVAGIRSTGLSSCLGISSHVSNLVKTLFSLKPSSIACCEHDVDWKLEGGVLTVNKTQYAVTHPLSLLGLASKSTSHL